jgi:hypothetical protein
MAAVRAENLLWRKGKCVVSSGIIQNAVTVCWWVVFRCSENEGQFFLNDLYLSTWSSPQKPLIAHLATQLCAHFMGRYVALPRL